jgi:hypothetical protein
MFIGLLTCVIQTFCFVFSISFVCCQRIASLPSIACFGTLLKVWLILVMTFSLDLIIYTPYFDYECGWYKYIFSNRY